MKGHCGSAPYTADPPDRSVGGINQFILLLLFVLFFGYNYLTELNDLHNGNYNDCDKDSDNVFLNGDGGKAECIAKEEK